jgi:predicted site-specific integrase-resolvase
MRNHLIRMKQINYYILTVADVAEHYNLEAGTVRKHLNAGKLQGVRMKGAWRCSWPDVWAAEKGPMPREKRSEDYKSQLLTKKELAEQWSVCEKTVERWFIEGLPTRNVFGSVRISKLDANEWTQRNFRFSKNVV